MWRYAGSGNLFRIALAPPPKHSQEIGKNWELDVPAVACMDLKKLQALGGESRHKAALKYIMTERAFDALWNGNGQPEYKNSNGMQRYVDVVTEVGIWKPLPHRQVKTLITAFTVPKPKKRRRRLIANAVPLNKKQHRLPDYELRLPDLDELESLVLQHSHYGELDGVSWFNQFGIPEWFQRHVAVRIGGKCYAWTRLPMGWLNSVDVAQAASCILQEAVPGAHLTYVDNMCRFGKKAEVQEAMTELLRVAKGVGASLEVTAEPSTRGTILGVEVNLAEKTTDIPPKFLERVLAAGRGLYEEKETTFRSLWEFFGCLFWCARIRHLPLVFFPRILGYMRSRTGWVLNNNAWDNVTGTPADLRNEIAGACERLRTGGPHRLCRHEAPTSWVYTDASNERWGVVWQDSGLRVRSGFFPKGIADCHIAIKELWAVLRAARLRRGKRFLFFCDNQNVVSWVRSMNAKPPLAMELLRQLHEAHQNPEIFWVPTELNPADDPSRDRRVRMTELEISELSLHLAEKALT